MKFIKNNIRFVSRLFFIGSLYSYLISPNYLSAETYFLKKAFVKEYNSCLLSENLEKCKKLISQLEKLQLIKYRKGNFKCQTSLLGVQTELISQVYFKNKENLSRGKMMPYVIKYC